jgi:argininosuccinate lyase
VQLCLEKGCELHDLSLGELQSLSPEFDQDFYESVKLGSVLAIHDVAGGTAPVRVQQAINATRTKIASLREEVHAQEIHAHA